MSFAKGTLVRLYNGSEKLVECLKVGEHLMGADNIPQSVSSLRHYRGEVYELKQEDGTTYYVGDEHGLVFCRNEKIETMTVGQFYVLPQALKDELYVLKIPFTYRRKQVECEPYEYGTMLGKNRCDDLDMYIYNSPDVQWELLAGVIDMGATVDSGVYIDHHVKEMEFVARCLGLNVSVKNHRLFISNKQIADLWNDTIDDDVLQNITVTRCGDGDIYSIGLNPSSRFLLPDFTVCSGVTS